MKIEVDSEIFEEMIDIIESQQGGSADDVLEYRKIHEAELARLNSPPEGWSPEC